MTATTLTHVKKCLTDSDNFLLNSRESLHNPHSKIGIFITEAACMGIFDLNVSEVQMWHVDIEIEFDALAEAINMAWLPLYWCSLLLKFQ